MIIATDEHGGLKRLAGAVLIRARKDFVAGSDAKRAEVEDWVGGRTKAEMSFELCCQLLELDPDYTRNRLFSRRLGSSGSLRRSNTKRVRKRKRRLAGEQHPSESGADRSDSTT